MRVKSDTAEFEPELQLLVMRYSLSWLAAGCVVGFLMASLLFHPALGGMLGEFTYGRWVPVHLNFMLFGWSALPSVGVLLKAYLRPGTAGLAQAKLVLNTWSLALAMGGVSWLAGDTSGKLFLDWSGMPRLLFLGALLILWAILVWNYLASISSSLPGPKLSRTTMGLKGLFLAGLAFVPFALYRESQRTTYPSIDPGTGGPTGSSLLISTLGIVLVIAVIPRLLGILRKPGLPASAVFWSWFALAAAYSLTLDHGNTSHGDVRQIAGVALLLGGVPTLILYLKDYQWQQQSRPWLTAAICWWASLVVVGFILFLPGILEHAKFTHALIAHADLAMPGLITSLNMLILANLSAGSVRVGPKGNSESGLPITGRVAFWLWQGALAIQVLLLSAIAALEWADSGELWKATGFASDFFALRLMTGISMGLAALLWVWRAWRDNAY